MPAPLRVAIIGCGWAGTRHAATLARCGAAVAWAIDVNPERAQALAASFPPARATTDYAQALADGQLDAVDICLPHNLHADAAVAAAEAGKHILCEKPIAATLEQADRMIAAAERAGVTLMVAENVRFTAVYQKIRDLLQDGVIGRPALLQMTRQCYLRRSFMEERPWFLNREAAAGGIMMSGGVHDLETMRMLLGEIESVQSLRARQRFLEMEGDDTSIAMVRFRDGAVGTLVESFIMKSLVTASGPEVHTLRIDGDLGSLWTEDGETIHFFSERPDLLPQGGLGSHVLYVPPVDSFVAEVQHFIDAVHTRQEPLTSGRSQRRPLEIVLAAYRSMALGGQPIAV